MYSIKYWNNRYKNSNKQSGKGSEGHLLEFKCNFINNFIQEKNITSITDFGHGNLAVAKKLKIKNYTGCDIFDGSKFNDTNLNIINCRFDVYNGEQTDLTMCLDVFFHLLKDEQDYLEATISKMINISKKYIIIYAQDSRVDNDISAEHVYNSNWIEIINKFDNIKLIYEQDKPQPETFSKFFIYEKI